MAKIKQLRRPDVPEADQIARYCNRQRVIRDPITDEIKGVYPQAFHLRTSQNEKYLSIHWLEYFGREKCLNKQLKAALKALRVKHRGVTADGAFARLNAGRVVEVGAERGHTLRVRDRSTEDDPGYASIENMPLDNSDDGLIAALAYECCLEVHGVAAIDVIP